MHVISFYRKVAGIVAYNLYLFSLPRLERAGETIDFKLRKGLALLAYVAVTRRLHSRDSLATLFWPEKSQRVARANLRRLIYEVSQLVDPPLLDTTGEQVQIHPDALLWVDVAHFQQCVERQLPVHPPDPADLAQLCAGTKLYTADFMAGFSLPDCPEFDEWQFFQREALRTGYATALQQLVSAHEQVDEGDAALSYARQWLALDPSDEAVQRRLMQLYAKVGQTGAALRQYDECVRILAAELDVTPEPETTALYDAIRTRRYPAQHASVAGSQTPPMAPAAPSNLPAQTTPFIGRQHELAELLRHLADPACRLLTLVGPGGIGKTRLALAAASALHAPNPNMPSLFPNGVYFVPLQPVNAPSGIISAVAQTLGLQFYSGAPLEEQLLAYLREKHLLLVLDNFEHLLAGAGWVAALLATASGVKVLATSREALKLHEEWFHPLAGMHLPPKASSPTQRGERNTQELINSYDAVQLFVQAARRAQPNFAPDSQIDTIVHICRLVDGLPLAIELAASWLKVLSCADIVREIGGGIDILVTRHQNVPPRHRSMRAVLDYSWQLLSDNAQRALRRIAVFHGGFRPASAGIAEADLLTLADLVDKAWLLHTANGRYEMHELLRQYAAACLADAPGEEADARQRHAEYYLRFVISREAALLGVDQPHALAAIDEENDNLIAAWLYVVDNYVDDDGFDLLDAALAPLHFYLKLRSRYVQGEELFTHLLHHLDQVQAGRTMTERSARLRYRTMVRLGEHLLLRGERATAERYFRTVIQACDDIDELAIAYADLGSLPRSGDDSSAAIEALQQSLALARTTQNHQQIAETLKALSDVASALDDYAAGKRYAEEALRICRKLRRPDLTAAVLAALAWAVNCLGEYVESERYYRESLTIAESIASPYGIAFAINFLGWVAYCKGGNRLPEALSLYTQAIEIWRQIGQRTNLAMCLGDYALAAYDVGDYAGAARHAAEGVTLTEELHYYELMSYMFYSLGAAMTGLGDLDAGALHLRRAL